MNQKRENESKQRKWIKNGIERENEKYVDVVCRFQNAIFQGANEQQPVSAKNWS